MPTEDAYSSEHLVLFHFWTCMRSIVETNLYWTCLVFGLLSFEHPSVLLFYFGYRMVRQMLKHILNIWQNGVTLVTLVLATGRLVTRSASRPNSPRSICPRGWRWRTRQIWNRSRSKTLTIPANTIWRWKTTDTQVCWFENITITHS